MPTLKTLLLNLPLAQHALAFLLPAPRGPFNVSLTTGPLVDHTRREPGDPSHPRTLMLSLFQPTECAHTVPVPYMPSKTAAFQGPFLQAIYNISVNLSPFFENARLPVCPSTSDCATLPNAPVLLFSPGYSIPRSYYSVMLSSIASQGFTVLAIDHPGDADIVVYPDGDVAINNDTVQTIADFRRALPARVEDDLFVLDQLGNATAMGPLLAGRPGRTALPTKRVAMFGHSLGGVGAVLAASQDSRIRAAANWDGTFVSMPQPGVAQPVLLLSHGFADASWNATWPLLRGPKFWANVARAEHAGFSDVPTLLQAAGRNASALEGILGTVPPEEMVQVVTAYTSQWMRGVFAGEEGREMIEKAEAIESPGVTTVRKHE